MAAPTWGGGGGGSGQSDVRFRCTQICTFNSLHFTVKKKEEKERREDC